MWPTLRTLTQTQFEEYAQRPGHYSATVTFAVRHHDVLATRPLAPGHVDMDRSTRMETVSPVGAPSPFHVVRAIVTLAPLDYEEHGRKPTMRIACADVRWSAIRTTDAGTVTRQLDIPDFVLQP